MTIYFGFRGSVRTLPFTKQLVRFRRHTVYVLSLCSCVINRDHAELPQRSERRNWVVNDLPKRLQCHGFHFSRPWIRGLTSAAAVRGGRRPTHYVFRRQNRYRCDGSIACQLTGRPGSALMGIQGSSFSRQTLGPAMDLKKPGGDFDCKRSFRIIVCAQPSSEMAAIMEMERREPRQAARKPEKSGSARVCCFPCLRSWFLS